MEELVGILNRYGLGAEPEEYKIVNVTARTELGGTIDLREASKRLGGIYDPNYRPYLIAKINSATIMLTHNGKLVVLGARSIEHAEKISVKVKSLVLLFKD
ncbi:MAG: hypothetical protein GXO43_06305 [Crenarchaeota archaeon]|nr:hypothetical protein [Thermoproteota archaeon]